MADDKNSLRSNSSVLVDGPSRAPARAMLKAVGFTDEDLSKPLIAVAHTWIEIMPCTAHLRDLAEHVKRGIRAAGATPDRVQHYRRMRRHLDGHARHARLAHQPRSDRRLDRAHRPRPSVRRRRRDVGMRQNNSGDRDGAAAARPALADDLRRLDSTGTLRRSAGLDSGCVRGRRRPFGRQDEARRPEAARGRCLSGRGRMRRAVHRQHDGNGERAFGNLADGLEQHSGDRSEKARERFPGRAPRRRFAQAQTQAEPDNHEEGDRECDRIGRDDRRLDQRRAASARDRARGGNRARHRRLRSHQLAYAAARRSETGRTVSRDRDVQCRRHSANRKTAEGSRTAPRERNDRDRQNDRRRSRHCARDRGAGSRASSRVADQENRRPGNSERQPRARRMRHQGRRPRAHDCIADRRAFSTAKTMRSKRSTRRRSRRATSSSFATKVRAAHPGCPRCSASPRPCRDRASENPSVC